MTINQAMNIARSGLMANQSALGVVSHNIANMNTEGYAKQRVNFAEFRISSGTRSGVSGQIASLAGVDIVDIKSYSNEYLNNYFRTQNSPYQMTGTSAEIATNVANILDELSGTGLDDSFNTFYEAANKLNQNPTDSSARINFVQQAKNVALKMNSMSGALSNYQKSLVGDGTSDTSAKNSIAGNTVSKINSKLEDIAKINKEILGNPNDSNLLSSRDKLLTDLSSMVNINTKVNTNGTVDVSIGKMELVQSAEVTGTLQITKGDANCPVKFNILKEDGTIKFNDISSQIKGGTLAGIISTTTATSDFSIQKTLNDLDKLAAGFAETLNNIQTKNVAGERAMAIDKDKMELIESTELLFTAGGGAGAITASNIKINQALVDDPYLVAAAKVDLTKYDPKSVGNADNALDIINSRTQGVASLDNQSPEKFLLSVVTKVGLEAESLITQSDSQGNILEAIQKQIMSETGVNLDEELTDMIRFQRAYQASARVFSTCSEILETLVTLGQ